MDIKNIPTWKLKEEINERKNECRRVEPDPRLRNYHPTGWKDGFLGLFGEPIYIKLKRENGTRSNTKN